MSPKQTMRATVLAALCGVTLADCGNGISGTPPGGTMNERIVTSVARWAAPPRPDRGPSRISAALKKAKAPLLFVSDAATQDVYVFDLSRLKLMATLTGFSQPQGECSDNKGDVWITDTNAKTIYEVSHQGRLENELNDSAGYPAACAWDKVTGNLAVMNFFGVSGAQGAVLVYKGGSGSPASYANPSQYYYNFGSYDAKGDLVFDGRDAKGNFMLSELAKGASSAKTIALNGGTIYYPGMVQWDPTARDFIVGDQSCGNLYSSCVYAAKFGKKAATITQKIDLQNYSGGAVCDLVQGAEINGQLAGSDNDFCGSLPSSTYLWPYPGGGAPILYNNDTDTTPVGAAVS
ncbi:MAG: hypothetical protein WCB99_15170, partial [Candidatus Cybelea sp.]